ncbi:MAG: CoA transferase [Saprospirales bacterium]|nr:CoA transferase [Saprospirales bacterium]
MQTTFFRDLKVVELASVLAGPAVGQFFAELGARVVKIEHPGTGGDMTRHWKLPSEPEEQAWSAYYCSVNWGKEVRFIDLSTPDGHAEVMELIRDADIVISNFRPEAAQRLKLDARSVRAQFPGLIFAELSAFGDGDPRPGFDVVLQAEAGFLFMSGEPGGPPVKMPVALIDLMAAHQLKEGILLALLHRERSGEGALVKTSLFDAAIASLANQAGNWLMEGHIPQPMGTQHPNIAPYGDVFTTLDGKLIVLAVGTDRQFAQLATLWDRMNGSPTPCWPPTQLGSATGLLRDLLQRPISGWGSEILLGSLIDMQIPAARIRNMKEVFELPQAEAMILEEALPDGRRSRTVKTVAFRVESSL